MSVQCREPSTGHTNLENGGSCLASAGQRGRITSLRLLATLLLKQLGKRMGYVTMSKESKTTQSWVIGTLLDIVGAVFSMEFGSFFSTNRRFQAELSSLFLRNRQELICLLLVPLNTEQMPKRPKGNERRGKKTGNGAV